MPQEARAEERIRPKKTLYDVRKARLRLLSETRIEVGTSYASF